METNTISILSCIIAAVSAVIAGISAYLSYCFKRKDEKADLEKELDRILEIGIQYPQFEYAPFTDDWINHRGQNNDIYLRYVIYCNLLFNYLHHVFEYHDGKKDKIESYVDVKTWVRMHRQNWQHPADENENVDGYDELFRSFINSYLE